MSFNAYTYRANKDERTAREWMRDARRLKAEGAPSDRVAQCVKLARGFVRLARMERATRDLGREVTS